MHVTAAEQSTNLEPVPVSSATNQQSSALEGSATTESGSNSNTSCKNKKLTVATSSIKKQQQRQHGNLDDEVRSKILVFILLIDFLIKNLLVRSLFCLLPVAPTFRVATIRGSKWEGKKERMTERLNETEYEDQRKIKVDCTQTKSVLLIMILVNLWVTILESRSCEASGST